jgi:hypothetical protein
MLMFELYSKPCYPNLKVGHSAGKGIKGELEISKGIFECPYFFP